MKQIILVDDSQTSRMVIKRCLEIIGLAEASFCEASNGAEALSKLQEMPNVDLLVTDLNMPVMDGEALLKELQGNPKLSTIPVLVITSAGNPAKETALQSLGAYAVLNKPVSPAALLSKLGSLLKKEGEEH